MNELLSVGANDESMFLTSMGMFFSSGTQGAVLLGRGRRTLLADARRELAVADHQIFSHFDEGAF